jgi:hypothetical protein
MVDETGSVRRWRGLSAWSLREVSLQGLGNASVEGSTFTVQKLPGDHVAC